MGQIEPGTRILGTSTSLRRAGSGDRARKASEHLPSLQLELAAEAEAEDDFHQAVAVAEVGRVGVAAVATSQFAVSAVEG